MPGFSYKIDPVTRDYIMENGRFVETENADTVMILALADDTGWWGDPEAGSNINETIRGVRPADVGAALSEDARAALERLVRTGRIAEPQTEVADTEPLTINTATIDQSTLQPVQVAVTPLSG